MSEDRFVIDVHTQFSNAARKVGPEAIARPGGRTLYRRVEKHINRLTLGDWLAADLNLGGLIKAPESLGRVKMTDGSTSLAYRLTFSESSDVFTGSLFTVYEPVPVVDVEALEAKPGNPQPVTLTTDEVLMLHEIFYAHLGGPALTRGTPLKALRDKICKASGSFFPETEQFVNINGRVWKQGGGFAGFELSHSVIAYADDPE